MKVAVGLSGGVDSAVTAYMLKKAGYDVVGIYMCLKQDCSADINDARQIADALGIELRTPDFRQYFKENIEKPFADEYISGRTPNPCIECNKLVKFGAMLDYALELGCEKIATGHYSNIAEENGKFLLKKVNSPKDQSYFLFRLGQKELSRVMFPIADLSKSDTRAIAADAGLPVATKKDSLEICFVPDDDYISYLSALGISSSAGNFIDSEGNILGRHNGIINYTVGQRKGLGAFGKPMFVNKISAEDNMVIIGENGTQYSIGLVADRLSFTDGVIPDAAFMANVKIRYRAPEQPALITVEGDTMKIIFDEPQRSVTPGQSAVIYIDDTVIGGGRIINQIP